ncbi:hypothetical protein FQA39_LY12051 [Lamprigera yunnana]|nr:hypothetical protein FQA39_LY12051 [Lamprigera yunnana]
MKTDKEERNVIVMGDMNGKVGNINKGVERYMGSHEENTKNDNGICRERFCDYQHEIRAQGHTQIHQGSQLSTTFYHKYRKFEESEGCYWLTVNEETGFSIGNEGIFHQDNKNPEVQINKDKINLTKRMATHLGAIAKVNSIILHYLSDEEKSIDVHISKSRSHSTDSTEISNV